MWVIQDRGFEGRLACGLLLRPPRKAASGGYRHSASGQGLGPKEPKYPIILGNLQLCPTPKTAVL